MRIFVILTDPANENLEKAIKSEFPEKYYDFGDGQWFVAGEGTASFVYGKLDNAKAYGDIGSMVVLSTLGYDGYASTKLWDWLIAMKEQ